MNQVEEIEKLNRIVSALQARVQTLETMLSNGTKQGDTILSKHISDHLDHNNPKVAFVSANEVAVHLSNVGAGKWGSKQIAKSIQHVTGQEASVRRINGAVKRGYWLCLV